MQANLSLGPNHGYRLEGDTAFLNVELAFDKPPAPEGWALQLWACEAPYQGGPLRGIKVAEAPLGEPLPQLSANAPAQLPPVQRDYAMVLVLASGNRGSYDQVHDFSNYPARQLFAGPHLSGSVGYRIEGAELVLQGGVRNPRELANLSGTLALELWALPESYAGGELAGTRLGQIELGSLRGQDERGSLEYRMPFSSPAAGEWRLTLLLREWTERGYQTRDYCNFPVPYRAEPRLAIKAPKRVSVSEASVEELAAVDGLNVKLAQAIVRARPFASLKDLMRVRGIGEKMLQKLRAQLTV